MITKMKAKCLTPALSAFCLLVLLPLQATADFIDGNQLVEWMRDYEMVLVEKRPESANSTNAGAYLGYVAATSDLLSSMLDADIGKMTVGQVCAVVAKFLKAHPEHWDKTAKSLVRQALFEGFGRKGDE
jgi:hypothetical protein